MIKINKSLTKALLFFTVILMEILAGAELDVFVPSFPQLQSQFELSPFWLEALLSVNFVGLCLSLFFVGPLADRYGRKPIILFGLVIFILGTLFCLFAGNFFSLLAGRFFQGVGIAAPGSLCFLIIADTYPIKEQQFLMAILNGVINATVGAAPIAGSYLTLYFNWQGNFAALLILGLIVFVLTLCFIPQTTLPDEKETLSLRGYFPIFRSKTTFLSILCLVFLFVPYWVFVGMSPLLFIEDLGVSLAHFGYYQGAFAMAFAVGSLLFGFVLNRLNQDKTLYASCWVFMVSLLGLGWVTAVDSSSPVWITVTFLVFIVGLIIPSTILYPIVLNLMPKAKGKISALLQAIKLIVTGLALQVAGYCYAGSFQNIGIILMAIISVGLMMLLYVIRAQRYMNIPINRSKS
jgi:MFS transporter, DHA1 family, multidrug resistance protein